MDRINYYKVLQVDPEAEPEVIKAAYRALSRKYHPDGSHPSEARMMRLNDAYSVLSDPPTRARHNDELERKGGQARTEERPAAQPRMRYQDIPAEPPKPRRPFRQPRYGLMTQLFIISLCALMAVGVGVLRPITQIAPPTATPTLIPPVFRMSPLDLQAEFASEGYAFDTEISRSGEPLTHGSLDTVAVYIATRGDVITYTSLTLSPSGDPEHANSDAPDQALDHLLDAAYGSGGADRSQARAWITASEASTAETTENVISGWLIRVWHTPDAQTGVAILPADQ